MRFIMSFDYMLRRSVSESSASKSRYISPNERISSRRQLRSSPSQEKLSDVIKEWKTNSASWSLTETYDYSIKLKQAKEIKERERANQGGVKKILNAARDKIGSSSFAKATKISSQLTNQGLSAGFVKERIEESLNELRSFDPKQIVERQNLIKDFFLEMQEENLLGVAVEEINKKQEELKQIFVQFQEEILSKSPDSGYTAEQKHLMSLDAASLSSLLESIERGGILETQTDMEVEEFLLEGEEFPHVEKGESSYREESSMEIVEFLSLSREDSFNDLSESNKSSLENKKLFVHIEESPILEEKKPRKTVSFDPSTSSKETHGNIPRSPKSRITFTELLAGNAELTLENFAQSIDPYKFKNSSGFFRIVFKQAQNIKDFYSYEDFKLSCLMEWMKTELTSVLDDPESANFEELGNTEEKKEILEGLLKQLKFNIMNLENARQVGIHSENLKGIKTLHKENLKKAYNFFSEIDITAGDNFRNLLKMHKKLISSMNSEEAEKVFFMLRSKEIKMSERRKSIP
jgi:hypothetical protein